MPFKPMKGLKYAITEPTRMKYMITYLNLSKILAERGRYDFVSVFIFTAIREAELNDNIMLKTKNQRVDFWVFQTLMVSDIRLVLNLSSAILIAICTLLLDPPRVIRESKLLSSEIRSWFTLA